MTKQLGALTVLTRDLDSVHSFHIVTNSVLLCFLLTFTVLGTHMAHYILVVKTRMHIK